MKPSVCRVKRRRSTSVPWLTLLWLTEGRRKHTGRFMSRVARQNCPVIIAPCEIQSFFKFSTSWLWRFQKDIFEAPFQSCDCVCLVALHLLHYWWIFKKDFCFNSSMNKPRQRMASEAWCTIFRWRASQCFSSTLRLGAGFGELVAWLHLHKLSSHSPSEFKASSKRQIRTISTPVESVLFCVKRVVLISSEISKASIQLRLSARCWICVAWALDCFPFLVALFRFTPGGPTSLWRLTRETNAVLRICVMKDHRIIKAFGYSLVEITGKGSSSSSLPLYLNFHFVLFLFFLEELLHSMLLTSCPLWIKHEAHGAVFHPVLSMAGQSICRSYRRGKPRVLGLIVERARQRPRIFWSFMFGGAIN